MPLRSAQTELRNTIIRIATHYCRTHRFDAPVPMHKVSQHMQDTMAQHQQKREKGSWNPQLHCARKSSRIRRQSDDARNRRAREPTFLRNGIAVYPKKRQCFVQILTFDLPRTTCKTQYNRKTQHLYSALLLPLSFSSLVFSTLPLLYL